MPKKDDAIEPINAGFDSVASAMVASSQSEKSEDDKRNVAFPEQDEFELVTFESDNGSADFSFDADGEAIWATATAIANVFDVDVSTVRKHIDNIYADEELQEKSTSAIIALVQNEGGRTVRRQVQHYNLDVMLSVGYRVNAKAAVKFRQWASGVLKAYVEQGYVINERALRDSPDKLNKLAAEIRALRSSEKQVYAKVRECFKLSSSDYDPSSTEVRRFYALLQDKFHYAVTKMTSSKLILDRADHTADNMGLRVMSGDMPTLQDAKTGKNYLDNNDLYRLHLLSEQFLLYAESTALSYRKMTMKSLHEQLDRLLTLNEYPVFEGYKDFIKEDAIKHAKRELGLFKKRVKIESLGIEYDEDSLASGEYDELLMDG